MTLRRLIAIGLMLLLSACGGGDGGDSAPTGNTGGGSPAPTLSNFTTVTVDAGPAALAEGPNGYAQTNVGYVSVTLCAPGTSTCQTIDHVEVDTGSVGLRIASGALNTTLLAALPLQNNGGVPVGECYGYVDGYAFGSVRVADFQVGGETVTAMPFQLIGDSGPFATAPGSCSAGGGTNLNTIQALGANGVLGIGVTTTDCGAACAAAGGSSAAIYYSCPTTGCVAIIGRAAAASAPFQQLPNPVAAMAIDNNGVILSLPAPPSSGAVSLTGTLYFGIGTQTNNALKATSVLPTTTSVSARGPGLITVLYNGQTLNQSTIDSGSNLYIFVDSTITACPDSSEAGYYCPGSPLTLSPSVRTPTGSSAAATFTLNNAASLLSTPYAALPGIGGNPDLFSNFLPYPNSFDFGLPFFYGRDVYTAIEGRTAGGTVGPYFAF